MIRNYLKIAFRNLFRNKVYSFINITGLAIGLAAAMLILLYTKDEVSYDRFHTNAPNIYRITNQWLNPDGTVKSNDGNTGNFQGPKFKEKIPEIETFARLQADFRDIRSQNEIKGYEMFKVEPNFLSIFSFPLVSGNPTTALQKPNSIILSEEMAEKFFRTTDVVGKTIEIKDNDKFEPFLITGVSKKCPENSSIKFDFLLPYFVEAKEYQNSENWFNFFLNTFVVLNPKADFKKVEAKMQQVYEADAASAMKKMMDDYGVKEKAKYSLQQFTEMHLSTDFAANNGLKDASKPMFSYILMGIALFILVIACINFINLTVARSLKRAKEIGVRKVVGSNRKQLILQFMGESFVLCLLAFGLAIALVQVVLPTFNQLANKTLAFGYLFDAKLILAYFGIFILTTLLSGFYPALVLSSYNPIQTLYSRFNLSGKNYLQKSLVVLQFGLASFLIIATLTIYSQFNYLTTKNLGYDDKNLVLVERWNTNPRQANLFKEQLLKNSNILDFSPKNGGNWGTIAKINGEQQISFDYETVGINFIPMLKIPITSGRNFSTDFPSDSSQSVIVNEAFVKKAGWRNPIGQEVNFWYRNEKFKVIGVIKDYHSNTLNQEINPQLFTIKDNGYGVSYIKIKANTESETLKFIEKTFKSLFPINAFTFKFKDLENIKNYESEQKWKQIMLFGAILTIFISCIGLFGLATLSAEKRTKEIGIRKVLGASVISIVRLLSVDFLKLVSISFVFAFPIAYYATEQWLKNYPYRININAGFFAITALITTLIALFTVSWQSIRAALMNPVNSIKTE